jgi:hypothetical protein
MEIRYLNTDFELESHQDLTPIAKDFGEDVFNLHNGEARGHFLATFETNEQNHSPDAAILLFCRLIEALPKKQRTLYDKCFTKTFDIGYEGGSKHQRYTDEIRPETLQKLSNVGASLRITVYPEHKSNE